MNIFNRWFPHGMLVPCSFMFLMMLSISPTVSAASTGEPLYERESGAWETRGFVSETGALFSCMLFRKALEGSSFTYLTTIGLMNGMPSIHGWFVVPIAATEASFGTMFISFDDKPPRQLAGSIAGQTFRIAVEGSQELIDQFQSSKRLTIAVIIDGAILAKEHVDLSGSKNGFLENGVCMSTMISIATERMRNLAASK